MYDFENFEKIFCIDILNVEKVFELTYEFGVNSFFNIFFYYRNIALYCYVRTLEEKKSKKITTAYDIHV